MICLNYTLEKYMRYISKFLIVLIVLLTFFSISFSQSSGSISGKVIFGGNSRPLSGASVKILPINRTATADNDGRYEFTGVPAGRYTVIAHYGGFEDATRVIVLVEGGNGSVDLSLTLTGVKEQVTVTATGDKQAAFVKGY